MIGWLSGTIRHIDPAGLLLLDAGGVGYEISVSMQTLCKQKVDTRAELFIHTHVREDQITLFGFASPRERSLFRRLTTVSGIGARMAMNLMSGMPTEELLAAIETGNATAIARTPGIGKKTAQRLILELQGKLSSADTATTTPGTMADVRSALINLGYKPAQVDSVLQQQQAQLNFEDLFRAALKSLG
ncbi:MAG: Holliday junction branch migration protein RuvA [Mariprofundaceae bacterium]